jgi:PAS domain S-box-containing protein
MRYGSTVLLDAEEIALLVDSVQDYAIFLLGPTGEIRSWNAGAGRIFGYTADEVIGSSFARMYPEVDIVAQKPQNELAVASATGRIEDEGWRVRKDGKRFWVNTVITALRNSDGTVRGFAKVTRDLTERREADERLRQSEELFRLLVESVRDYAIFMLDTNGMVTSWNAGAERIKGYKPAEIIGRSYATFFTEEDLRAGKPERELELARERGAIEDEGWRVRKDGTRFWANAVLTAVHGSHGELRGYAKVLRDITDRKVAEETQRALLEQREARMQAEQERQRAEAAYHVAQEANRAKDEFMMTLSHELRTPMTAVLGWSRLLPTLHRDDELFADAIAAIARGAELQARLIDDVLDVSRIVSGKLRLRPERVDLATVLDAAVESVRQSADAKSISINRSYAPALGSALVDGTRLQQVVWNLLTNAVKFTTSGGAVHLIARRSESNVQIIVSDTGEGIEPTFLPHVFEPFRQAENPRTRVHGGLGLGLSIVRYIVEAHGGTIQAESAGRGRGSQFTVTLPLTAVVASEEPHERPARATANASIDSKLLAGVDVLIVDDDRDGRAVARAALTRAGATVRSCDSGASALGDLDQHVPDLILTDIAMPVMDGYEFVRTLRERPDLARVKVIALSAFAADKQTAESPLFDVRLLKPIDPFALVDAIAKAAGRKAS